MAIIDVVVMAPLFGDIEWFIFQGFHNGTLVTTFEAIVCKMVLAAAAYLVQQTLSTGHEGYGMIETVVEFKVTRFFDGFYLIVIKLIWNKRSGTIELFFKA